MILLLLLAIPFLVFVPEIISFIVMTRKQWSTLF